MIGYDTCFLSRYKYLSRCLLLVTVLQRVAAADSGNGYGHARAVRCWSRFQVLAIVLVLVKVPCADYSA